VLTSVTIPDSATAQRRLPKRLINTLLTLVLYESMADTACNINNRQTPVWLASIDKNDFPGQTDQ